MHYYYHHHHHRIIIIPFLLCYYYYYCYIFDILHIIIIRWQLLHVLARTYILFAAFGPACRNMSYRSLAADRVYKATTDDLQPERKNSVGTVFKKAFGTLSSSPRRRLSEPLMSGVPVIGTGNINTPLRYITRAYINICVQYRFTHVAIYNILSSSCARSEVEENPTPQYQCVATYYIMFGTVHITDAAMPIIYYTRMQHWHFLLIFSSHLYMPRTTSHYYYCVYSIMLMSIYNIMHYIMIPTRVFKYLVVLRHLGTVLIYTRWSI